MAAKIGAVLASLFSQCVIPLEISKTLLPELHDLQGSLCFTFMFVRTWQIPVLTNIATVTETKNDI